MVHSIPRTNRLVHYKTTYVYMHIYPLFWWSRCKRCGLCLVHQTRASSQVKHQKHTCYKSHNLYTYMKHVRDGLLYNAKDANNIYLHLYLDAANIRGNRKGVAPFLPKTVSKTLVIHNHMCKWRYALVSEHIIMSTDDKYKKYHEYHWFHIHCFMTLMYIF